jgi:hypothetical protein
MSRLPVYGVPRIAVAVGDTIEGVGGADTRHALMAAQVGSRGGGTDGASRANSLPG